MASGYWPLDCNLINDTTTKFGEQTVKAPDFIKVYQIGFDSKLLNHPIDIVGMTLTKLTMKHKILNKLICFAVVSNFHTTKTLNSTMTPSNLDS